MTKEELIVQEFRTLNEESKKQVLLFVEFLKWKNYTHSRVINIKEKLTDKSDETTKKQNRLR